MCLFSSLFFCLLLAIFLGPWLVFARFGFRSSLGSFSSEFMVGCSSTYSGMCFSASSSVTFFRFFLPLFFFLSFSSFLCLPSLIELWLETLRFLADTFLLLMDWNDEHMLTIRLLGYPPPAAKMTSLAAYSMLYLCEPFESFFFILSVNSACLT